VEENAGLMGHEGKASMMVSVCLLARLSNSHAYQPWIIIIIIIIYSI
jgi:hypothetical protein